MRRRAILLFAAFAAGFISRWSSATTAADPEFEKGLRAWQEERAKRVQSPTGWLTVVGLAWLQPGENAFGSDPAAPVRLPERMPRHAGVLVLADGKVTLKPAGEAGVMLDGKPAVEKVLADDASGNPDVLRIGEVSFFVIRRGEKIGVRVRDPESPARKNFQGLEYFPPSTKWRVEATFVPHASPRKVAIPTVLGTSETMDAPGIVKFTVDGKEYTLEPVIEDSSEPSLWFIFKDQTSAKETYGAGRFLYAPMPENGKTVIDFNRAYNPPCALTPYATCPLPPKQNWLPVRVEAGEKAYAGAH